MLKLLKNQWVCKDFDMLARRTRACGPHGIISQGFMQRINSTIARERSTKPRLAGMCPNTLVFKGSANARGQILISFAMKKHCVFISLLQFDLETVGTL